MIGLGVLKFIKRNRDYSTTKLLLKSIPKDLRSRKAREPTGQTPI
jgi:hypothetical protein